MTRAQIGTTQRSWQLATGLVLVLVAVVIAALAAITGDADTTPAESVQRPESESSTSPADGPSDAVTRPFARAVTLPDTKDPDVYAEAIAELVLGLSPATAYIRGYRDVLLGAIDRDVVGDDYDRLVAVTGRWIPDEATWNRQAKQRLRSDFEVESVVEPEQDVFAGDARPGYEVRTVSGEQTIRYEDENGDEVRDARARSVTVWVHCSGDRNCSLVAVPEEALR